MAAVTLTAAQVALVFPDRAEVVPAIAAAVTTVGQAKYYDTDGNVASTLAGTTAANAFHGVALKAAGAGQAIDLVHRGHLYGFDLSNVAYGGTVYAGTAAGAYSDSAVGGTVPVGICVPLTDPDRTKVLYVMAKWGLS